MTQNLKSFKPADNSRLFSNDPGFQELLSFVCDEREADRLTSVLTAWEKKLPAWNDLSNEAARPEKLPRVEKYDRVGNRLEKVVFPPETKTIRREVVEAGIFSNQSEVEKFAKIYLLAQIGEGGVTCPLACTDGLIRVVQALGSDFLKKEYLPKLLSAEYPLSGAQFITEQSGGSDVGAIEGTARENKDGSWAITAEKWYCSAYDEFFCLAARPDGSPEGTRGVAIFFVPRLIDGKPNNLSIRRLKNKLGTQSLPTAEVDFEGSKGWLIGKKEDGFYNLMNYILNVSRIHNAANSLALHRRAFVEALNYAGQRVAFGSCLIDFPLIQQSLLSVLAALTARRGLFFSLLAGIDKQGLLPEEREQRLWQRFLINLMKYRTAFQLTGMVKEAILVFGANGIIEDFSILPRLLRDSLIVETWEGPHNVLCLQILRDVGRFDFFSRFKKEIGRIVQSWPAGTLDESRKIYLNAVKKAEELFTKERPADKVWVQTHARRIVDHLADLLEIGGLVRQGITQKNNRLLILAAHLTHESFRGPLAGFENPVIKNLPQFGLDLVSEKPVKGDLKGF
ncbi:MAG: acyl-CoA dehydrogenase family protein [Deltaproteobacteria bacterium]|nr:acyl-CoA dehydrogenase family protein [Deltaproteobacteria bacterium]